MTKTCPRCQQSFDCRPDAIQACGCASLSLSPDQLTWIRTYTEQTLGGYVCLCTRCLAELATLPLPSENK